MLSRCVGAVALLLVFAGFVAANIFGDITKADLDKEGLGTITIKNAKGEGEIVKLKVTKETVISVKGEKKAEPRSAAAKRLKAAIKAALEGKEEGVVGLVETTADNKAVKRIVYSPYSPRKKDKRDKAKDD